MLWSTLKCANLKKIWAFFNWFPVNISPRLCKIFDFFTFPLDFSRMLKVPWLGHIAAQVEVQERKKSLVIWLSLVCFIIYCTYRALPKEINLSRKMLILAYIARFLQDKHPNPTRKIFSRFRVYDFSLAGLTHQFYQAIIV